MANQFTVETPQYVTRAITRARNLEAQYVKKINSGYFGKRTLDAEIDEKSAKLISSFRKRLERIKSQKRLSEIHRYMDEARINEYKGGLINSVEDKIRMVVSGRLNTYNPKTVNDTLKRKTRMHHL